MNITVRKILQTFRNSAIEEQIMKTVLYPYSYSLALKFRCEP